MSTSTLPTVKDVRDLLGDLLGRPVEVTVDDAPPADLDPRASIGVYQDDWHNITAVVITDLTLSAHLAAALALTSKDAADDVVSSGSLDAAHAENLHETLNVLGTLFNRPGGRSTRLVAMHAPGEPVPPRPAALASTGGRRLAVTVSIPGYGSGQMALVM